MRRCLQNAAAQRFGRLADKSSWRSRWKHAAIDLSGRLSSACATSGISCPPCGITYAVVNTNLSSALPRLLAFPIPKPVVGALERVTGIRQIQRVYSTLCAADDTRPIAEKLLQHLEVTHRIAQRDIDQIPKSGAAVMV